MQVWSKAHFLWKQILGKRPPKMCTMFSRGGDSACDDTDYAALYRGRCTGQACSDQKHMRASFYQQCMMIKLVHTCKQHSLS